MFKLKAKWTSRIIAVILVLIISLSAVSAGAVTWVFGTSGTSKNPFTPRGYVIQTSTGTYWLSSRYDNSSTTVKYTGSRNGLSYVDADEVTGLYAMTDRNPTPGKNYLVAYKNGSRISLSSYVGTPGRASGIDPSGNGTCWVIPIEGFQFEKGCEYEFAFLRGMQANNGITLVLSEDGKGYIQAPMSEEEQAKYNQDKNEEYKFIASYSVSTDEFGEEYFYDFHVVPMRFRVQTYADMTVWNTLADEVRTFLAGVRSSDYQQGLYKRKNIESLTTLFNDLEKRAEEDVKLQLQESADKDMAEMVEQLSNAYQTALTDKPVEADISKLENLIKQAESLYASARDNVGTEVGQYGKKPVDDLGEEIQRAKLLHKYSEQSEINAEVEALSSAIVAVKASKVSDSEKIFFDRVTGIYVTASPDAFPDNAVMHVRRMDAENNAYKAIAKKLNKDQKLYLVAIEFYQDEYIIQPTKAVTVQVPIPKDYKANVKAHLAQENGTLNTFYMRKVSGKAVFSTNQLGLIALTGQDKIKESPKASPTATVDVMNQTASTETGEMEQLSPTVSERTEIAEPSHGAEAPTHDLSAAQDVDLSDIFRNSNTIYIVIVAAVLAGVGLLFLLRRKKDNDSDDDEEDDVDVENDNDEE